jgi:hypothetical protein
MITAGELRIGNLICWNPKLSNPHTTLEAVQIEVSVILKDKIGYIFPGTEYRAEPFEDDLLQKETRHKSFEELEPIILTTEILEMCGFKQMDDHFSRNLLFENAYKSFSAIDIDIADYRVSLRFVNGQWMNLPYSCKFLHQLQNLYFALTIEELEISL